MVNFLRFNKHIIDNGFTYFVKPSQILRKYSSCSAPGTPNCPCPDPCGKWDKNWDKLETRNEKRKMKKCGSKADVSTLRHLILIRSGEYSYSNKNKLTERGRRQVDATANRLLSIKCINWSKEQIYGLSAEYYDTVDHINNILKVTDEIKTEFDVEKDDFYMNCQPPFHGPGSDRELYENCPKAETVFRYYFHRKTEEERKDADSYIILVMSDYLLSYLVCRAVQFPPEVWGRINSTSWGSMTWISIPENGNVHLRAYGENGYMDPDDVVY